MAACKQQSIFAEIAEQEAFFTVLVWVAEGSHENVFGQKMVNRRPIYFSGERTS